MWAVVADADGGTRETAERILVSAGFLVIGCENAQQLMTAALRTRPALVVSDLDMEGAFDGAKACLRLLNRGVAPAVIMTSADVRRARATALPRNWRMLPKPFSPEILLGLALWASHGAAD